MARLKEPLQPWQKISWNNEQSHIMFRDWGKYHSNRGHTDAAEYYNRKSLALRHDDPKALLNRAHCMREIARPEVALKDNLTAQEYVGDSSTIDLNISDALYDLNEFEVCKTELHNNTRKYHGNAKVQSFLNRLDVVNANFKDSLGDSLGPFFLNNERHFANVVKSQKRKSQDHPTQFTWKSFYEQGKCDVQSVYELEDELLSPLETARRKRAYKVYNQIYFNSGWADVLFLKELCSNSSLLLPESKGSTPLLRDITQRNYDIVKKSLKMLHARSPLYNEKVNRCRNNKMWEEQHEAYLNRMQYQTRRNTLAILKNVKYLRSRGNIESLTAYVEEIMGDYIVLKTHRIMPWKYEFVHEIYNILALAHADRYVIPDDLHNRRKVNADPLLTLLRIPKEVLKEYTPFVFGDRSTYEEPEVNDPVSVNYKKYIARLEKRLHFAKYSTERCYILYEIARTHLTHRSFDDCSLAQRRAIREAKLSGNALWEFHCTVLILKFNVILRKVERAKDVIRDAKRIAERLKSLRLIAFLEECSSIIHYQLEMKRRNVSQHIQDRRKRSKYSSLTRLSIDDSIKSGVSQAVSRNASFESNINYGESFHELL